jgi:hypothetical protein
MTMDQPLCQDPNFRLLMRAYVLPRLCIAYKGTLGGKAGVPMHNLVWRKAPGDEDFVRHERITEVLGEDFIRMIVASDLSKIDNEINIVRRNFARFRLEHAGLLQVDRAPEFVESIPIHQAAVPSSIEVCVDWPQGIGSGTKKFIVPSTTTADDLAKLAVAKFAQ